jgi:hypothetical protein
MKSKSLFANVINIDITNTIIQVNKKQKHNKVDAVLTIRSFMFFSSGFCACAVVLVKVYLELFSQRHIFEKVFEHL